MRESLTVLKDDLRVSIQKRKTRDHRVSLQKREVRAQPQEAKFKYELSEQLISAVLSLQLSDDRAVSF